MPCQFPSYHPSQVGRFWGEVVMRRYDYDRPWRLAAQARHPYAYCVTTILYALYRGASPRRSHYAYHTTTILYCTHSHRQVRTITRAQLLAFFDAYLAPAGPERRRLATHVRVSHRVRLNPNPHPNIPTLTLTLTRLATHVYSRKAAPRGQLKLDAVSEADGAEPLYYPPEKPGRLPV